MWAYAKIGYAKWKQLGIQGYICEYLYTRQANSSYSQKLQQFRDSWLSTFLKWVLSKPSPSPSQSLSHELSRSSVLRVHKINYRGVLRKKKLLRNQLLYICIKNILTRRLVHPIWYQVIEIRPLEHDSIDLRRNGSIWGAQFHNISSSKNKIFWKLLPCRPISLMEWRFLHESI